MERMRRIGAISLLGGGCLLASCGRGGNRVLESISISPNPAVAKSGTVQLVATGTFSSAPVTVTPLAVDWSLSPCDNLCDVAGPSVVEPISVNDAGLANCNSFKGTFPVRAAAPKDPSLPPDTQNVPTLRATANLTCE